MSDARLAPLLELCIGLEGSPQERVSTVLADALRRHLPTVGALVAIKVAVPEGGASPQLEFLAVVVAESTDGARYAVLSESRLAAALDDVGPRLGAAYGSRDSFPVSLTLRDLCEQSVSARDTLAELERSGVCDLLIFPVAIATHLVCVAIPIDAGAAPPTAEEQLFVGAVARLATLLLRPPTPAGPSVSPSLSDSERAVLTLALEGLSEKQIALKLRRSPHTVHTHLRMIYRAYGVGSRAELLLLHLRGPD